MTESVQPRLEALMVHAGQAMRSGRPREAVRLIEAAEAGLDAGAEAALRAVLRRNLGIALAAAGEREAGIARLREALAADPEPELAHLNLARLLLAKGERLEAARQGFRALTRAQAKGRWRDAGSTPPGLRPLVLAVMDLVDAERRQLLDALLRPFEEAHGRPALARIRAWLEAYLGHAPPAPADPARKARFLFLPGLAEDRIHPRSRFPWIEALEARTGAIRAEALAACSEEARESFLHFGEGEDPGDYLGGAEPRWEARFFYRDGRRFDSVHTACPTTSAAIEALPLVRIADHAPEICFSLLGPDTHIKPHHGVTNTRLVVHLPLVVPRDCALHVAGLTHAWREGEVLVFDDTWRHEAWNRSDRVRIILLMDTWHPDLEPPEREALAALVEGIGRFNRA
ncbi:aspartyl/asparaginyl beta-hydroxylase domain-containing protein [Silanimonas lenta]|uniref:aspartyl/asparaginyl beta-hydroxylase domain-containing protein n=1 Tax=Silanimonas lenta TaxID=265429 RepID=UPI002FE0C608